MVLHLFLLGLLAVAWNMQFQKGMTVLNVTTQQIWTCYLASLCLCKATLPSSELSSGLQHCLELLDLLIQGVGVLGLVFHIPGSSWESKVCHPQAPGKATRDKHKSVPE